MLAVAILKVSVSLAASECHFFDDNPVGLYPGLTVATPEAVGVDSARLALVDKQINDDVIKGFPGAALIIIKDNKVIKQTVYGYKLKYSIKTGKSLKKPKPVSCDTLFDLASNTKMYATNYALMHLVYTGKLDINKPVNFYIPEYSGCDSNNQCREKRTVRDLLTHTAGYMPDPQLFNPEINKLYGPGLYSQNRNQTESILLSRLPFQSAIGGKPNYSDVDYMLLGILVERITNQRLDEYVKENIYRPLMLHNTIFNPLKNGFSKDSCAATEVMGNTRGLSVKFPNIRTLPIECQVHDEKAYYSMAGISGHAGLFSDIGDMAALLEVALNNGSYGTVKLWDKQVETMFTSPQPLDNTFGLGWRLAGPDHNYAPFGNYASNRAFGHTGWTGTITLIDPKYNLAIVLLTNKKHSKYTNGKFAGDSFATGQYHQIIDLIYKSLIPENN